MSRPSQLRLSFDATDAACLATLLWYAAPRTCAAVVGLLPIGGLVHQAIYSVELGETGVAAFAGILAAMAHPKARTLLGLNDASRVIAIASEGVTDPGIYQQLLDRSK